jgi:hypothetical protein
LRGLRLDFLGLLILPLIWLSPPRPSERDYLFRLAYFGLALLAVIGSIELFIGPKLAQALGYIPYDFYAGKIRQVHSLLPTPNMLGSALVLLTALSFRQKSKPSPWLMLFLGILVGSTFSRSAWLALATLGAIIFFYNLIRRRLFTVSVVWLAIGLTLGIGLGIVRWSGSLSSAATHDRSNQQHAESLRDSLARTKHFGEFWFTGDGIGTSGPATLKGDEIVRISESWYIQIFQELGLIGFGLFLTLMVALVRSLWQQGEWQLGAGAIALSVNALFLHIWADNRLIHILFWTLAALVIFVGDNRKVTT